VMCHPSAGATMKYLPYADGEHFEVVFGL